MFIFVFPNCSVVPLIPVAVLKAEAKELELELDKWLTE